MIIRRIESDIAITTIAIMQIVDGAVFFLFLF